jgi:anaerobic magnesium-protoporphyrin IX monomethyl ester cyclase
MRYSLVNPCWSFEGSIYFGCHDPHLPLEFGYSRALLEREGHAVQIVDAHLDRLGPSEIRERIVGFRPDFIVVTTAPSYLFWRCPPPELRVVQQTVRELRGVSAMLVCVGPHASTTPRTTLLKTGTEVVVLGECEEVLPRLAGDWRELDSICYRSGDKIRVQGQPRASNMTLLPALRWERETIAKHLHHHHRFDRKPAGPGAEMETSRGCPYHCTFCAKDNFRDSFRRRPLSAIEQELSGLAAAGAEYVYFIDEIFLPYREVLECIADHHIEFGIQTRIDLWSEPMLDLLGEAGCVSIEAGVESVTESGREALEKRRKISTEEISDRLIYAKTRVPFVQANLLDSKCDHPGQVEAWRARLREYGVWANKPVPLFPYPGSPEYTRRWGSPDDVAWERAMSAYLEGFDQFSDIQEQHPIPLAQLEVGSGGA